MSKFARLDDKERLKKDETLLSPLDATLKPLPSLELTPASPIVQAQVQDQTKGGIASETGDHQQERQRSETQSTLQNDTQPTFADPEARDPIKSRNRMKINLFRRKSNKLQKNKKSDLEAASQPELPDPGSTSTIPDVIPPLPNSMNDQTKDARQDTTREAGKVTSIIDENQQQERAPFIQPELADVGAEETQPEGTVVNREIQGLGIDRDQNDDHDDDLRRSNGADGIGVDEQTGREMRLKTASSTSSTSTSNTSNHSFSQAQARGQARAHNQTYSSSSNLVAPPLLNTSLNSSESWLNPLDSEGQFIRRTYAHFDMKGVKGDGFVEGKEWTRVRASRAAWEVEDDDEDVEDVEVENIEQGSKSQQEVSLGDQVEDGNEDGDLTFKNETLTASKDRQEVLKTPTSPSMSASSSSPFGFLLSRKRTTSSRPTTPMGPPVSSEDYKRMLDRNEGSRGDHEQQKADLGNRGGKENADGKERAKADKAKSRARRQNKESLKGENDQREPNFGGRENKALEIDSVLANGITHDRGHPAIPTSTSTRCSSPAPNPLQHSRSYSDQDADPNYASTSTTIDTSHHGSYTLSHSHLDPSVELGAPYAIPQPQRGLERANGISSNPHEQVSFLTPLNDNGPRSTNSHESGISGISRVSGRSHLTEINVTLQERIKMKQEAERKREEFLAKVDRYGFFSRRLDESLHGRVAILPSEAYSVFPSSTKSERYESKHPKMLQSGQPTFLPSPSLSEQSGSASQGQSQSRNQSEAGSRLNSPSPNHNGITGSTDGSLANGVEASFSISGNADAEPSANGMDTDNIIASVSEARRRKEEASKKKEVDRVKKWNKMLIVSRRDEGLNILKYGFLNSRSKSSLAEEQETRTRSDPISRSRSSTSEEKLRRRIYKGIPDPWRSAAWGALVSRLNDLGDLEELSELKARSDSGTSSNSRDRKLLENIKKRKRDEISRYQRLVERPSPHDVQIDLDVPRTISGHVSFHTRYGKGQRSLFHLLHCFSLYCKDCGYCQGMGPIAATLLCYLTEEVAYETLCSLHGRLAPTSILIPASPVPGSDLDQTQDNGHLADVTTASKGGIGLHETFQPGFPGVVENFFVHESLVSIYLPRLSSKFKSEGISTSAYATRWYITLFANSVPFETQLRLWDALLFEGRDALVIFSLAILWGLRDRLSRTDFTFEKCLEMLSSYLVPEDDDSLMDWCREFGGRSEVKKQIRDMRKEWKELVEKGEAMSRLL